MTTAQTGGPHAELTRPGAMISRPPIDRTSATDAAAQEIRALILTGELAAGTLIRQGELAAQLGLSRTPLREALQHLAAEGLVHVSSHRGATVARPTRRDVNEIYELQILLEAAAARWASDACADDGLATVRAALENHERSASGLAWMESNAAFHSSIYRLAGRPLLCETIEMLRNRAALYVNILARSDEGRARADTEHRAMAEALAHRDSDRLAQLVRQHLQGTLDWLQDYIPD